MAKDPADSGNCGHGLFYEMNSPPSIFSLMKTKKRKHNFSKEETTVLLDDVERRSNVLFSKLHNQKINDMKKKCWMSITANVNAVNRGETRSFAEVKKKWHDLQCITKRKESWKKNASPDRPFTDFTAVEKRIIEISSNIASNNLQYFPTFELDLCGGRTTPEIKSETDCSGCSEDSPNNYTDSNNTTANSPTAAYAESPQEKVELEEVISDKKDECTQIEEFELPDYDLASDDTTSVATIQRRRLRIEEERLKVERRRLEIEEQRLIIEKKRLQMDENREFEGERMKKMYMFASPQSNFING